MTLVVALITPTLVPAQDVTEPSLKAAYLLRFMSFTEWPPDAVAPNAPLVACVVADNPVADALQRDVKGRTINAHPISVARNSSPRGCHLLYLGGGALAPALLGLQGFQDAPVLTMSDVDGFAQAGGLAQFYFEHSKLKFIVNMATLKRTRLHMSALLLQLAKRI
ncbi:MAG: YfiR family protein [Vicinamibacterales bacterium]